MDTCDVLIVGGGPAGSTCAWSLHRASLDVVVMDRATFPRDKVCAGWITPQVVDALHLDTNEYRHGRTFQPFAGFRVGVVGGDRTVETRYDTAVSFGIRRCEFDEYLLRRSGARLTLGTPAASIVRDGRWWIVNDAIRAPMLVGAGGHFCPVARSINREERPDRATALVVAQEAEFAIDPGDEAAIATTPDMPELYFCRDMRGYGWSVRKEQYLNVGFGRLDCRSLPRAIAEFVAFLGASGRVRGAAARSWHGHAYLVSAAARRRALDESVLLVGDAAGLAYPQSGEGIRPAVQSGLFAARTIIDAAGRYTRERLQGYDTWLRDAFDTGSPVVHAVSQRVPAGVWTPLARRLLASPAFVRHVVLNRGFLRA
jgi:menaquinone-9 beta-reductase